MVFDYFALPQFPRNALKLRPWLHSIPSTLTIFEIRPPGPDPICRLSYANHHAPSEVSEYFQRKAADYDRWLRGMRRLQATNPLLKEVVQGRAAPRA